VAAQYAGGSADTFVLPLYGNQVNGFTPADGDVWYHGQAQSTLSSGAINLNRQPVPVTCTLNTLYHQLHKTGTAASGELTTTKGMKNNSTLTTGVTSAWTSAAASIDKYSEPSIAMSFTAGDDLYIQTTCPTWVTNPTGCRFHAAGYFTV
jgi:hypothetical protein